MSARREDLAHLRRSRVPEDGEWCRGGITMSGTWYFSGRGGADMIGSDARRHLVMNIVVAIALLALICLLVSSDTDDQTNH